MEEVLDRIRATLSGLDQSDTPQLRKLAETYAEACRAVNAELAACRELIDRGLWTDASRRNDSVHPAWSRRAAMLAIAEREAWATLCRLYSYPVAPEPDLATVQLLEDPPESGKAVNKLIMQWRRIARAGASGEKVKLLRRIIAAAPAGGSDLWRKNLAAAEKSYSKELMAEAERAMRVPDMTVLQNCYNELISPDWLEPVPRAGLEPFQQLLQEHQKEEFRKAVQQQLDKLGAAYSALDAEQIRHGLAEWDKLVTHPFFAASDDEMRQVAEVRSFLEDFDARQQREREGREKTRQLIMELDRHGDFNRIENLYEALRQSDFPIDATLDRRVAIRREEFQDSERRRHRLRCFLVASLTILLLALGGAAILFYQYHRANVRYRASMQEQLDARNYDAVLQLYKQAEAENPRLVNNGNLSDLKAEAERRKVLFLEAEEQYQRILNELDTLWKSTPEPSLPLLRAKLAELDKLEPEYRSAELREAGRRQHNRCQALADKLQRRRDEAFLAQVRALEEECTRLQSRIRNQEIRRTASELAAIRRKADVLTAQGKQVSPELRDSNLANLKLQLDNLNRTAEQLRRREAILHALFQPRDWDSFCKTMTELPEQMPDLAQGEWRRTLTLLPLFRATAQSALLGGEWENRAQFQQQSAAIRALAPANPILQDIGSLLEQEDYSNQTDTLLQAMQNLGAGAQCELIFRTEDGQCYRFYPTMPPKLEKRRNSRLPKALSFQYLPAFGGSSVTVSFRIPRTADSNQVVFETMNAGPLALPQKFIDLTHADILAEKFPPPIHTQFLTAALPRLRRSAAMPAELEREVLTQLKNLKQSREMNPYIRVAILDHLLKLLRQCSKFYDAATSPLQIQIARIGTESLKLWNIPSEAIDHPKTVQAIEQCFQSLNLEQIQQHVSCCRNFHRQAVALNLAPAAVVSPRDGRRLCWFGNMAKSTELFLPVLSEDGSAIDAFWRIGRDELGRDDLLPEELLRRPAAGLVVFAPQSGQVLATLRAAYLQSLSGDHIPVWPASWPKNCRESMP